MATDLLPSDFLRPLADQLAEEGYTPKDSIKAYKDGLKANKYVGKEALEVEDHPTRMDAADRLLTLARLMPSQTIDLTDRALNIVIVKQTGPLQLNLGGSQDTPDLPEIEDK
jgi:hypothetical protein